MSENNENGTGKLMEFNADAINSLSAIEVTQFIAAAKTINSDPVGYVQKVSAMLAKCAVSCPPEWGDPKSPETYQNLPWKTTFQDAVKALSQELNSDTKN
jgi:hypothetical protein